MKEVKQKPKSGAPRLLRKTIRVPAKLAKATAERGMRKALDSHKDNQSPDNYAIDKSGEYGKTVALSTLKLTGKAAKKAAQTARKIKQIRNMRQAAGGQVQTVKNAAAKNTQRAIQSRRQAQAVQRQIHQAKQSVDTARRETVHGIKTINRAAKAPKQAVKAGVKTAKAGKIAVKSTKVAIKTAQTMVKSAKAAAHAARTAIQAAKAAAKAAVTIAKAVAKAAAMLAKMAAAAAKALIAAIAAGGWVVVVIIIAAAAIAAILCSAFGIFWSNEADGMPMTQAIIEINTDFTNELQRQIDELSAGGYDAVVVSYDGDYDGDSEMVNNWQDVLGVYAVKTTTDETEGADVITLTPEKVVQLKEVFNAMNEVHITTRTETQTTTSIVNGEEVTITTTTLYIDVRINSLTYQQGAEHFGFLPKKMELLEELMSPDYYELFAMLLGVDMYGGLSRADLTQIVSNLPAGTKGTAIVQAALSKVGTLYSQMDCSQLVQYAYAQTGITLPRTSVAQAQYCYSNGYMVGASQLQPGDIVFWSKNSCTCGRWNEIHHTGVYVGGGKIVDASSGKGRVMLRNLWSTGNWQIWGCARPHI